MKGYDAYRLMVEEGKRIRRRAWAERYTIYIHCSEVYDSSRNRREYMSAFELFQDDWEVVEEPDTMGFMEAMQQLNSRRVPIRRLPWLHGSTVRWHAGYLCLYRDEEAMEEWKVRVEEVFAKDWIVEG